jgi:hypothetical protein
MGDWVKYAFIAALLVGGATGAFAQGAIPAEASVVAPDLHVGDADLGDERKFFFFHKQGVSFADAYADLSFCSRYIARGPQRSLPAFVPWQRDDPAKPIEYNLNYGLVGVAIMAIIDGPIDRSIRQARLMRCMLPRGYSRYRTSEALWKQVNGKDLAASVAVEARIASGPVPPTPRTLP